MYLTLHKDKLSIKGGGKALIHRYCRKERNKQEENRDLHLPPKDLRAPIIVGTIQHIEYKIFFLTNIAQKIITKKLPKFNIHGQMTK